MQPALPGLVTLISRRGEVHVDAIGMKAIGGSDPMILVEECKPRLDEPVDRLLPELAERRVHVPAEKLARLPPSYGGLGTSGYSDPSEELVGILMTQRLMDSPESPGVYRDFWTSAYQAIDD
jgi:hypothetical protein